MQYIQDIFSGDSQTLIKVTARISNVMVSYPAIDDSEL